MGAGATPQYCVWILARATRRANRVRAGAALRAAVQVGGRARRWDERPGGDCREHARERARAGAGAHRARLPAGVVVVVPRGGVLREGRLRLRPHRPRYAGLPCGRLETCRQAMAMLSLRHFHDACLLMAIGKARKYGVLPAATRSGPCASRWLSLRLSLRR